MTTTAHRVYKQDHTGTGILKSEHRTKEWALIAAQLAKAGTEPTILAGNVWYVASPKGDGRWDVKYV